MATLTVRLLGSPEITFGQQRLSFRTRKALALLIYLVIEKGDAQPRGIDGATAARNPRLKSSGNTTCHPITPAPGITAGGRDGSG